MATAIVRNPEAFGLSGVATIIARVDCTIVTVNVPASWVITRLYVRGTYQVRSIHQPNFLTRLRNHTPFRSSPLPPFFLIAISSYSNVYLDLPLLLITIHTLGLESLTRNTRRSSGSLNNACS